MSRQTKRAGDREGFVSEAALCETLAAAVRANGWRWYPETSKWDAIIVLPDDTQIGVQAKLRGNVDVLAQALPELGKRGWPPRVLSASEVPGPDKRVVLVPDADGVFRSLATHLRLGVLRGRVLRGDEGEWFGCDGTIGASTLRAGEYLVRVVEDAPRCVQLSEELAKAERRIGDAYWRFTRCARAVPPSMACPEAYVWRAAIQAERARRRRTA